MSNLRNLGFSHVVAAVARVFTGKNAARVGDVVRLVERAADKGFESVVDVEQLRCENLSAFCDNILGDVGGGRNNVERAGIGNGSGHAGDGVGVATHGNGKS